MLQVFRDFKIGKQQILAALLLLLFLAQCLWVSSSRRLSDLEYDYIASGLRSPSVDRGITASPVTGLAAATSLRTLSMLKRMPPVRLRSWLAIPHPWLIRLPFVVFGLWLGGALWWVARRLFGDRGGYLALALYCLSPAMVKISSNIGPEIILAWSTFGMIYTAIGVAHTVYAPPRKWIPRIVILGIAIGVCISTALWAFTVVLLAFAFMLYLSPGRRKAALVVFLGACVIGVTLLAFVGWIVGYTGLTAHALVTPRLTLEMISNLGFIFVDSEPHDVLYYVLPALFGTALVVYASWRRARYFGNTAPLITSYTTVLLFALVPAIHIVEADLGLSFAFLFIGGVGADVLETRYRRIAGLVLTAFFAIKGVLGMSLLSAWIHQNPM
jgi:hypothetical protein